MTERQRRTKVWDIPEYEFINIISRNSSLTAIAKEIGVTHCGSISRRIEMLKIDQSHIKTGLDSNRGRKFGKSSRRIPHELLFKENSRHGRRTAKFRIISDELIPYICQICGIYPLWNKKALVLILDHINGIHNDHRLENLRFLCPNCNSQTDTFSGRNKKYK